MSKEQADLWEFGSGVDPEKLEDHEETVIEYRSTVITTGRDDIGIRFDEDVIQALEPGLHPDSKSQEFRLHLGTEVVTETGERSVFLTATPTQNDGKFDITVWKKDGYPTIGFPRWVVQNEELRVDVENPFYGLEAGDAVLVRAVSPADEQGYLEIYTEDMFKSRFDRIVRAIPLVLLRSSDSAEPVVDLAAGTPYQGKTFEINFIDGAHRIFVETAKSMGKTERTVDGSDNSLFGDELLGIRCDSDVFDEVRKKHSVPQQRVREMRIYWSELEGGWENPKSKRVRNMGRKSLLYRGYNCRRFYVRLPEKGDFIIVPYLSRDDYPSGSIRHQMGYSDEEGWSYFHPGSSPDTDTSPTQLFILPKMQTRQGNTVIAWGNRGNPIVEDE